MRISVLDKGYVEFIEAFGKGRVLLSAKKGDGWDNEAGIIEAARQSTQGAFRGWDQDEKLLRFLYERHHDTPFEFSGMIIEVQAPIFVFREWHRHRTQSYNEMSARYTPLPDLYYLPDQSNVLARMLKGSVTDNKQEASIGLTSGEADVAAATWLCDLDHAYKQLEELYQQALNSGIPKELARLSMPVSHYSRMRASANLRNWLAFLTLRMDPAAQWETRQFAAAVAVIISEIFPRTYKLFIDRSVRTS